MEYDFFDMIVCITLRDNKLRQQQAIKVFNDMKIQDKVVFYIADRHKNGGMYGCFESHIKVIEYAFKNGMNRILVFEDDIYPTASYSIKNIVRGINFMKNNPWDIFYYGYFPINEAYDNILLAHPVTNYIIKYNPNATHAYCLNRTGMEKIIKHYHKFIGKIHIDEYFSSKFLGLNSYCFIPILFEQHLCLPSDNNAIKLSHKIARNFQCTIEKTETIYLISILVWIYKSIWILLFIIILIICIIIFKRTN